MQNLYVFLYHDEDVYCKAVDDKNKFDLLNNLNPALIIALLSNDPIEEYEEEYWYDQYINLTQNEKDVLLNPNTRVRSIYNVDSLNDYINTHDAIIKEIVDLGVYA